MLGFRNALVAAPLALAIYATQATLSWAAPQAFVDMPLEDFFLDRASLVGKQVRLVGDFQSAGDIVFLVLDHGKNATFVGTTHVPRDQRKALLDRCSISCSGVVTGKVVRLMGDIGVDAISVELRN